MQCAVAVQEAIGKENADGAAGETMRFRIGIHVGDVIVEGTNLFGDAVNIAARLEAVAEPGGICVSGTVRDQIRTKLRNRSPSGDKPSVPRQKDDADLGRGCARLRKTFIAGPPHARVVVAFDACPAIQDLPLGQCYRIGDFTPRTRLCKWCGRYQLVLTWLFILGCAVAAWIVQYGTGYRKGARDAIRDKILKAALDASRR